MKTIIPLLSLSVLFTSAVFADENLDGLRREIEALKSRVTALEENNSKLKKQIDVERLIVRKELIVSDTGEPWEKGFEAYQIPRGIYARSLASRATKAAGLARLHWDADAGADAWVIIRDGKEVTGPIRIEGRKKEWTDTGVQ